MKQEATSKADGPKTKKRRSSGPPAAPRDPDKKYGRGRPSVFTKALAERICAGLAEGKTLLALCRDDETLPTATAIRQWALKDVHKFYSQYTKARQIGLDAMAEEILQISDQAREAKLLKQVTVTDSKGKKTTTQEVNVRDAVDRARLMVDTRKWYLCKLAPKRYGDRVTIDSDNDKPDDMMKELAMAIRKSPLMDEPASTVN